MRRLIHLAALLLTVCNVQAQVPAEPSTYIGTPLSELVVKWLYSPDPACRPGPLMTYSSRTLRT